MQKKTVLLLGTALVATGYWAYNKITDMMENIKFSVKGVRAHNIIGLTTLRLITKVEINNQSQSNLNVSNLQVFIQYLDKNKNLIDFGGTTSGSSFSVKSNVTQPVEIATDLQILSFPFTQVPGLLIGQSITVRVTTSFTVFGKRITEVTNEPLKLPDLIISILKPLLGNKISGINEPVYTPYIELLTPKRNIYED